MQTTTRPVTYDELTTRGIYVTSPFRADTDLMVWWITPTPDAIHDGLTASAGAPSWDAASDRRGRLPACTGRRSFTTITCPRLSSGCSTGSVRVRLPFHQNAGLVFTRPGPTS